MAITNEQPESRPPGRIATRGRAWARVGDAELHLWGTGAVLELHPPSTPLLLTWTDTDETMVTSELAATLRAAPPSKVDHPELIKVGRRGRVGDPATQAASVVLAALRATAATGGDGVRWEITIVGEELVRTVTFSPADASRLANVLDTWAGGRTPGSNRQGQRQP
jgi:hypothetical protein